MKVINLYGSSDKRIQTIKECISNNNIKYLISNYDEKILLLGDIEANNLQQAKDFKEFSLDIKELTYDIMLSQDRNSFCIGWASTIERCKEYIENINGTDNNLLMDYNKGKISIFCNETGIIEYEKMVDYKPKVYYYTSYEIQDGAFNSLIIKANSINQLSFAHLHQLKNHDRFAKFDDALNYIADNAKILNFNFDSNDIEQHDITDFY